LLYLHEIHQVRPGQTAALLHAVEHDFLPIADRNGMRLVGYWETAIGQGPRPETVAVWELDDFAHYTDVVRKQRDPDRLDPELRDWYEGTGEWVQKTEGLVCFASKLTPTVAELKANHVSAKLCSHEQIHVQPARQAEYLELCEEMWWRRVAEPAGRSIVGLYWSPWKNTRAICIWGQGATWEECAPFGQGESWTTDRDMALWQTLGREIRTDWDDRFLVPTSFSTVR
jgi:hypothetical protein